MLLRLYFRSESECEVYHPTQVIEKKTTHTRKHPVINNNRKRKSGSSTNLLQPRYLIKICCKTMLSFRLDIQIRSTSIQLILKFSFERTYIYHWRLMILWLALLLDIWCFSDLVRSIASMLQCVSWLTAFSCYFKRSNDNMTTATRFCMCADWVVGDFENLLLITDSFDPDYIIFRDIWFE